MLLADESVAAFLICKEQTTVEPGAVMAMRLFFATEVDAVHHFLGS
jgi:hypothetical protein